MKLVDFLYRMKDEDFYQNNKDVKLEDVLDELIKVGDIIQEYITKYNIVNVSDFAETYSQNDTILIDGTDNVLPDIMQLMLQEIK